MASNRVSIAALPILEPLLGSVYRLIKAARIRRATLTIVGVEAKSVDHSAGGMRSQAGCPWWEVGPGLSEVLSPGLELDVLDGDVVHGELEVADGADELT
jgi:hypothetical protein